MWLVYGRWWRKYKGRDWVRGVLSCGEVCGKVLHLLGVSSKRNTMVVERKGKGGWGQTMRLVSYLMNLASGHSHHYVPSWA